MAVREIAVNTATLARVTAQLTTLLARLEKDKAKMVHEIQELNRMWQGPSNQAFNDQFKTDCTSLDNLCRTIREMIGTMENAKREYDQCDNRVNALVSALKI